MTTPSTQRPENEEIAENIANKFQGRIMPMAGGISWVELVDEIMVALDQKDAIIEAVKAEHKELLACHATDHEKYQAKLSEKEVEIKKQKDLIDVLTKPNGFERLQAALKEKEAEIEGLKKAAEDEFQRAEGKVSMKRWFQEKLLEKETQLKKCEEALEKISTKHIVKDHCAAAGSAVLMQNIAIETLSQLHPSKQEGSDV